MKQVFKQFFCILCVLFLLTPMSAFGAERAFMSGIGNDFRAYFKQNAEEQTSQPPLYEELSYDEMESVDASDTEAEIYLEHSYMTLSAEKYNIIFNNWSPIPFEHNGYTLHFGNLSPGTFYKIRISYLGNTVGEYSFFTRPAAVEQLTLEQEGKTAISLKWENPHRQLTEIFKRVEGGYLKYIGATREASFTDNEITQGTGYGYKLRFVCKNPEAVSFSDFRGVSTYVEEDINDIINTDGYLLILQTDKNNRSIPYPYKGNGKTVGTSGCGVCASLMVIRNTSKAEPTVEGYTNELLEAGCRKQYGSDMVEIARYMKKAYGFSYSVTKDVETLKRHLDKGYMATAHVGTSSLFTTTTGHFVTVAGYIKSKHGDKAIILDPGFSKKKYNETKRVLAGIEYTDNGILTAPFETLLNDCKGEYFVLFTPPAE